MKFQQFLLAGEAQRRQAEIFKIISQAVEGEGYVFILLPEIEQTKRWLSYASRLGSTAVFYHSRLSGKKRSEAWESIISGKSRVVIGTRAILFLPVKPVRLIVVDEVQNDLYDLAENPPFDVREGAQIRAKEEGAVLLLTSSCPPVSLYYHSAGSGELIDLGQTDRCYTRQFSRQDLSHWLQEELKVEAGPVLQAGRQIFFLSTGRAMPAIWFALVAAMSPAARPVRFL